MKIMVINGSPRANSNSGAFANAFAEGARAAGHDVEIFGVGKMKINGCLGCEYCHGKGDGKCIQQDDMQQLYAPINEADVIVIASPIHYWSFSGQVSAMITRFYAGLKPAKAKRYVAIFSSMSPGVYDAPLSQLNSTMKYWGAELEKVFTFNGTDQQTEENLKQLREYGSSL